jgi:Transcriptional regulators
MENSEVDRLVVAFHQLKHLFHFAPQESEITRGEFFVLNSIRSHAEKDTTEQGVRLSSLYKNGHISKSGISQMLSSLERKGFVVRTMDETDRRAIFVRLTPFGTEFLEKMKQKLYEKMEQVIQRVGKDDIDLFMSLFDRFTDAVREVFYGTSSEHEERVEK